MREVMEGRAAPAALAALLIGARDEGRAAGRDRRLCADDARARGEADARRSAMCSTRAELAGIARARSISLRPPRSWSPRAACRSPSTAIDRCRADAAAPTCSRRSASTSTASPAVVERALREAGIAFFFAPTFHPSMKHAAQTRTRSGHSDGVQSARAADESGRRNAADGRRAASRADRAARARAADARIERAWVVHGADGIDEISTTGYTKVSECRDGAVNTFYVHPSDFGIAEERSRGTEGRRCGATTPRSFATCSAGTRGPRRDVVLLNAGVGAVRRRARCDTIREGIAVAASGNRFGRGATDVWNRWWTARVRRRPYERRARSAAHHRRGDAADRRDAPARRVAARARASRRISGDRRTATRSKRRSGWQVAST